jgi:hypothetical protein
VNYALVLMITVPMYVHIKSVFSDSVH